MCVVYVVILDAKEKTDLLNEAIAASFHFLEYLRIKNVPYYFLTTFDVRDFPRYS